MVVLLSNKDYDVSKVAPFKNVSLILIFTAFLTFLIQIRNTLLCGTNSQRTVWTRTPQPFYFRIPCIFCKLTFKKWIYVKRHMVSKHNMDPDDVQNRKAQLLAKAANSAPGGGKGSSSSAPSGGSTPGGLNPQIRAVKALRVDVLKVNLAQLGGNTCELVGPLGGAGVVGCPVLAQRTAAVTTAVKETEGQREGEEEEEIEERMPEDVERKIMETVNRHTHGHTHILF